MPKSVRQPICEDDAQGYAPWPRPVLLQYGECGTDTRVLRRQRARSDCHTLCRDTGAEAFPRLVPAVPQRWNSGSSQAVSCRGHWRLPLRCSAVFHSLLQGCCASFRASLCPSGSDQLHPPQTGLAHRGVSRLPFPVHGPQFIAPGLDPFPNAGVQPNALPPLKGAVDRAVVSERLGQLVPLASRAQPKDDPVEHLPGVCSLTSPVFRRVKLPDQRLDLLPKVVRYFPNGVQVPLLLHGSAPRKWIWN